MNKTPPLRAIQAFEAFGRRGSVTAAANELGVSVGAVSQQIRKAEDALDARLLERRGRSVALTALGRVYHAAVSIGFEKIREAQDVIEQARFADTLTISCLPSLASKWIGPQLLDWQIGHPGATVRLVGAETEPRLSAEQVDFRISYGTKYRDFEHYTELFTDWVVPACSPALLAKHPVRKPADILDLPLLSIEWARDHRSPPTWAEWAASIGAVHRKTSGEVAFSLSSAAIDAAANGRGFVLAQLSMAADDIASGRLVAPFDKRIRLPEPYFLAWDRAMLEKPFGPELRTWIVSISKRLGATLAGLAER
ncbi:LysR family transcriptional regulator [Mesorhizobium sp. WSM4307]|uniref:LysR substrate-binding domain-containing protein n=1 Tax=unclassified Mesorhizobium TaxID=325217 RepID=UPI00115C7DF3|nr:MULTISPECIES: LysR substrate-binding domain-containing protein [unclassified Mesorhizobium]TRC71269.1 LysR family transcriptional regulator [Mesorhizobium sp. WSM4315]TRC86551.1 LysR family transcriptional regulator [Mesorhizobium sp. WSM4307]